jgi:L-lactate utilization protein LutC
LLALVGICIKVSNFQAVSDSQILQKQLVEAFGTMFKQQAGNIYMAKTAKGAAKIVDEIVKERSIGIVCCGPFLIDGKRFDSMLDNKLLPFEKLQSTRRRDGALGELGSLDVGITSPRAAISQTGSLVEICSSDNERLLSSLSRVHIAVLKSSAIVENLFDIAPMIRSALTASKKPTITLIGGPSRTSDIELKSVLGVHGPHEVDTVIIE